MRHTTLYAALEELPPVSVPTVPQWPEWYAFDFDGTLVEQAEGDGIGAPVPAMVEKAKALIRAGKEVRIFTARVAARDVNERNMKQQALSQWAEQNLGATVKVTNEKDPGMVVMYDNRARQVVTNTGELVGDVMVPGEVQEQAPAVPPNEGGEPLEPPPTDGTDPAPETPAPTDGAPDAPPADSGDTPPADPPASEDPAASADTPPADDPAPPAAEPEAAPAEGEGKDKKPEEEPKAE